MVKKKKLGNVNKPLSRESRPLQGLITVSNTLHTGTAKQKTYDLKHDERRWTNELHLFNFTEKVKLPKLSMLPKHKAKDLSFEFS